jgi:hypothetical protein
MAIFPIKMPDGDKEPGFANANSEERKFAAETANSLFASFPWCETAEGSDFWASVHERLTQISKDGQLR